MWLLGLVACALWEGADTAATSTPAIPPLEQRDGVPHAVAVTVRRPAPAWVSAALPPVDADPAGFWDPDWLPREHVVDGLCFGDPEVRKGFEARVAEAQGRPLPVHGRLLRCETPGFCTWAAGQLEASGHPAYWEGLIWCAGPEYRDAFVAADAPDRAVVAWFERQQPPVPFHPRVVEAARRVAVDPGARSLDVLRALWALAAYDRPEVAEALLALHAEVLPPLVGDVALAMHRQSDPGAQRVFREACGDPTQRQRIQCDPDWYGASDPVDHLDQWFGQPDADAVRLVEARPSYRRAIQAELEACVERVGRRIRSDPDEAGVCVRGLAALDWSRAARMTASWGPELPSGIGSLVAVLQGFESREALVAYLEDQGLLPVGATVPAEAVTPADILLAAGRGFRVRYAAPPFPTPVDQRVRQTLALGGVFLPVEVIPPLEAGRGLYTLHVWRGQTRYRALVREGDIEDLGQPVGLANTLLEAQGAPVRALVVIDERPLSRVIVAGPSAGLSAAVEQGILVPAL